MAQTNAINNKRISILYGNAFSGNITVLLSSLIIAYLLKEAVPAKTLVSWLILMYAVSFYRFFLLADYKKNNEHTPSHQIYETRYSYATGLIGVGWAIIIYTGLNQPEFEYRIYSILLLTAIISIAIPIFSSSIKTIYFYITPSLITSVPILLLAGGNFTALGLAIILFAIMIIRAGVNNHKTLLDAISLSIRAQDLNKDLSHLHSEKIISEERMQDIMNYAPAAICVKDLQGHFTFANKKAADLYKTSHKKIIGKTLFDILPHDIATKLQKNDMEVCNTATSLEYEESVPQDDGIHHYISIKFPLFDPDGNIYAVGGVSTDITERVRVDESLRMSQQRLLLHREQSPVGIIEWNTNFEIIEWNPAAEKIFGFTKEEIQENNIIDKILPESAKPAVNNVWKDLLSHKGGTYSLNENITKDGRVILCEWHNTPLVDNKGIIIGVTSLVDDVTQRQINEENIRHTQKMDAIGKLTGGIAHDFNNMLGVILGFSYLLNERMPKENEKLISYSQQITTAAENAKKLTSKLLEFSRKAPSSNEKTYITTLLEDMRHMLERTLTARIKLNINANHSSWPVWIDKSRLEDAILNMSINSMHAMPDGGKLTLTLENAHLDSNETNLNIPAGDYVKLTVSDNGIGMSNKIKEKIFDPFFTTKGTEGTGLGLSQVYGFVQQSNCGIHVDSIPGQGTDISLYIPRYVNDKEHNTIRHDTKQDINHLKGTETILVVDDEPALLELTQEILTRFGYTVLIAERAKAALDILKQERIDLIISDVIMPEMDGYQLATEVEKHYPDIKIQIVSGYSDKLDSSLSNQTLHENRIHKPFHASELLSKVRQLLDNK